MMHSSKIKFILCFLCAFLSTKNSYSQCIDYGEFDDPMCDSCAPNGWTPILAAEIDPISNYINNGGACEFVFPGPSPTGGNLVALDVLPNQSEGISTTISGLTPGVPYQLGFWWTSVSFSCNNNVLICCADFSITVDGVQYLFTENNPEEAWSLAEICVVPTLESISIIVEGVSVDNMQGKVLVDDAFCSDLSGVCCDLNINASAPIEVCPNENIQLEISYSDNYGPATIMWDCNPPSGLNYLDNLTSFTPNFYYPSNDPEFSGQTFTYTAFVEDDSCGLEAKQIINVLPFPEINFDFDNTSICESDGQFIFPLNSAEGYSGNWDVASINLEDYAGTTFQNTFIITDPSIACHIPKTFSLDIEPLVINTFDFPLSYCNVSGETITFPVTSQQNTVGSWNYPSINLQTANPGIAQLVFTPDDAFCSSIVEVDIEIVAGLELTFDIPPFFCQENSSYQFPSVSNEGIFGFWDVDVLELSNPSNLINFFHPFIEDCIQTYSINVSVQDAIQPTFDYPSTICRLDDILILSEVSNEGFQGTWDNNSIDPSNIIGNSLSVTWSPDPNLNECTEDFSIEIEITEPLIPEFELPYFLCSNDPLFLFPNESDQSIPGTWSISEINPEIDQGKITSIFTPDFELCAESFSWEIEVTPFEKPIFNIEQNYCSLDDIISLPTISDNGIAGIWSIPSFDPELINEGTITSIFTPEASVVCTEKDSITCSIVAATNPIFSIDTIVCPYSENIDLPIISNNGIEGSWSMPTIDVQNNIGNTVQSIFLVNNGICATNAVINVQILPSFDNTLNTINPTNCTEENGIIEILGDLSQKEISIDGGNTWTQQSSFNNLAPGNFELLIRYTSLSDCYTTLTTSLTAPGAPLIESIVANNISNCTDLSGSIEIEAVGNALEYSIDGGATWQTNPIFDGLETGNYTVSVREIGVSDCVSESSASISDFPTTSILDITPVNPSDCGINDGSIGINAIGFNLEYSIDGGISFLDQSVFNNLPSGDYFVIVQSKEANDCRDTLVVLLAAPDSPSIIDIEYEDLLYCEPTAVSFTINANGSNLEYSIDNGNTWQLNSVFDQLNSGTYSILVRDALKPNCFDLMEYDLNVQVADPIDFSTDLMDADCPEIENGTIIVQNVMGGFGDYQYALDGVNFQQENIFTDLPASAYEVFVMDKEGCLTSQFVTVESAPEINITLEDFVIIDEGEQILLNPNIYITEIDSFKWSPSIGLLNPNELIVEAAPLTTTTYTLMIFYGACMDVHEITIEVRKVEVEESEGVYLGSIFTPNDDGINDYFYVQSNQTAIIRQFIIYDRWGNQVFNNPLASVNVPEDGWNGKMNGSKAIAGVYAYFIEVEINEQRKIFSGSVTVIY